MPDPIQIRRVRFKPAPTGTVPNGTIGFASFSIPNFGRWDGLAVRQTGPEAYSIQFPARRDRSGRRHAYFVPNNRIVRDAIERGVISALRARGELP